MQSLKIGSPLSQVGGRSACARVCSLLELPEEKALGTLRLAPGRAQALSAFGHMSEGSASPLKERQPRSVGNSGLGSSGSSAAEEDWKPTTVTAAAGRGRGMRLGAAARRQQQEQAAAAEPLLPTSVPAGGGKKDEEAGWDGEDEVGWRLELLVQVCTCQRPF